MLDKDLYKASLKGLSSYINSIPDSTRDIIIALSRKGPRMLEYLLSKGYIGKKNIITEHALPFLFDKILNDKEGHYNLYIVDDAVYYGSTLKGLIDEIKKYIEILKLEDRVVIVGAFVAIKDKSSIDIDLNVNIGYNEEIRDGYGHYFVKNIMNDIRSLGESIEIEFPTICYKCNNDLNIDSVYSILTEIFGKNSVCKISDTKGIPSISVIISDADETTFRKLRVYLNNGEIKVVSLSPELQKPGIESLKSIAFGDDKGVEAVWETTISHLLSISNYAKNDRSLARNINRTGIVLMGYFSSCDTFAYYKSHLEKAFAEKGYVLANRHLDIKNLVYLTGSIDLAGDIVASWNKAMAYETYKTTPIKTKNKGAEGIVSELMSITDTEIERLVSSNKIIVFRSETLEEALSAMAFNQTVLIERMTRIAGNKRPDRLRFGYTYSLLRDFLINNSAKLSGSDITQTAIHAWMDSQIDNGSIVPQYIIDKESGLWTRVFRPGENEDILLSHLGRIVAFVLSSMLILDEDIKRGEVLKSNLEGILSYIYCKYGDKIEQEEPCLHFFADKNHELKLRDKAMTNVVDFLVRMSVLNFRNDKYVSVNDRLDNGEFSHYTTLDSELQSDIDLAVKEIVERIGNKSQVRFLYPNTINLYHLEYVDKEDLASSVRKSATLLREKIIIIRNICQDNYSLEAIQEQISYIRNSFMSNIKAYELNKKDLEDNNLRKLHSSIYDRLINVAQLVYVLKILTNIYYYQEPFVLNNTILNSNPFDREVLHLSSVIKTIDNSISNTKDVHKDTDILDSLISFIETNVK